MILSCFCLRMTYLKDPRSAEGTDVPVLYRCGVQEQEAGGGTARVEQEKSLRSHDRKGYPQGIEKGKEK